MITMPLSEVIAQLNERIQDLEFDRESYAQENDRLKKELAAVLKRAEAAEYIAARA